MTRRVFQFALVMMAVVAMAGPAVAFEAGRSEVAPGVTAPDGGATGDPEALWPGPDGFGYTGSACTYSWVDITGNGTEILLGDDTFDGPFAIGFSFPFYGTTYTEFYTASNGYISFGTGSSDLTNQCPLPDDSTPNDLIALMWDDLNASGTDPLYFQSFASCPVGTGQCLVVLYDNYHHYGGPVAGTFEAILFDDGTVRIQFLDAGDEEGSSSTTGMEAANAASDWGLTYACNTAASLADNTCIEIAQRPGINLTPDEISGATCPETTSTHNMGLYNNSGADTTFALSYSITSGNASISGPPSILVVNGATGNFDVDITSDAGLPAGTPITGSIDATGGGYSDASAIAMNASSVGAWVSVADTLEGVRYHATAYHDGNVYQFGGETGWWAGTANVQRYNIAGNSWDTPAALPAALYGMGAVTIGDNIYVVGGSMCTEDPNDGCTAGTFSDAVHIFDTSAGTWSTDATDPMLQPVAYASLVTDGTLIYLIGGLEVGGTLVDTLHIYDPAGTAGSRWSGGASMAIARAYASSAVINGMIYVAGGWTGGTTMTNTTEVYDIAANTWAAGPSMADAIAPYGGGALGELLVVYGNLVSFDGSTTYTCSAATGVLNTANGIWSPLPDLPRCLYGSEGVSDGSFYYSISGRTNEGAWHMALENEVTDICGPIPVELMQFSIE